MARKLFYILLKLSTVISTLVFMFINFENITYYLADFLWPPFDPTKSLNVKYQYWLEDIYGKEEGFEAYWKIVDFTIWIIKHHINLILFVVISLMMILCIWIDKKNAQKTSKILKAYFIICIIIMLIVTFVAGPFYIDSIYDS